MFADNFANALRQFPVGKGFGTDGVDNCVVGLLTLFDGQLGQVIYINGLDTILTITKHAKHGKAPQSPSDVVNQNIFFAKQNGGPKNGVGKAGVLQGSFQFCLAAEIFKRGVFRRIGNADMHNPFHARRFCCLE